MSKSWTRQVFFASDLPLTHNSSCKFPNQEYKSAVSTHHINLQCRKSHAKKKNHFRSLKYVANTQAAKIIWFSLIPGCPNNKKTKYESVSVIMSIDKGWRWSRNEKSVAWSRDRQHSGQEPRKSLAESWEMWSYSRANLALETNMHWVSALETTRKDGGGPRTEDVPRSVLQSATSLGQRCQGAEEWRWQRALQPWEEVTAVACHTRISQTIYHMEFSV